MSCLNIRSFLVRFVLALMVALCAAAVHADSAMGWAKPKRIQFEMKRGYFATPSTERFIAPEEEISIPNGPQYDPRPFHTTGHVTEDFGSVFTTEGPPITNAGFNAGSSSSVAPPDCTIAIGPSNVVSVVNAVTLSVSLPTGTLLSSVNMNALTGSTDVMFDPHIKYDAYAGRFIGVFVSYASGKLASKFWIFYSNDSTGLGIWNIFSIDARLIGNTDSNTWCDYPQIGLTDSAICLSGSMFPVTGSATVYAKLRFMNRTDIYAGGGFTYQDFFNLLGPNGTLATLVPVSSWGAPSRFYAMGAYFGGSNKLAVLEFDDTVNHGATTTLIGNYQVTVGSFAIPPNARMPGTFAALDSGDCRLLQADAVNDELYAVHCTAIAEGSGNACAIKAYKLKVTPNTAPVVLFDSTLFSTGFDYMYPSIAGTSQGAAVICFGRSATTEYPNIRVAGFKHGATTIESSTLVKATTTYTQPFGTRFGDYFCSALSPTDIKTVWMIGEYNNGVGNWQTWAAAAKFNPHCFVTMPDITIPTSGTGTITAHVVNSDTNAAVSGATVTFTVPGILNQSATSNASGDASFTYTVPVGTVPYSSDITASATHPSLETGSLVSKFVVSKANTTTSFGNFTGANGQTINLSSTLLRATDNGPAIGQTVFYFVNGVFVGQGTTNASGVAQLAYTISAPVGAISTQASFEGSNLYNASFLNATLTVTKANTTLTVPNVSGLIGSTVALTATLRRTTDNAPVAGKAVSFAVGGTGVGTVFTDAAGVATYNWVVTSQAPGAYGLGATFAGDTTYNFSSTNATLTRVSGTTITVNSPANYRTFNVVFNASLVRNYDNSALAGKSLNFTVDGVSAGSAVTNASGIASINYTIPGTAAVGSGHTVTAAFAGDATNAANSVTGPWTVVPPDIAGIITLQNWLG
ncbi:MAG: hypothetical protein K8R88_03495, partial [Armatimonadetes bacterium]|nr:hypothetical protein [Armatimonadota bacterium]